MGWFTKAFKGLKKIVKKAARNIKKVTKKIVTSIPGGDKIWSFATRVGTKVAGAIGKVTNALGPIGMIAMSVLAPYAAPLWAGFGTAASVAAAGGSIWGSIGTAIYNGVNWAGATLSSMTKGITEGISHIASKGLSGVMEGSIGEGFGVAAKGFAEAFTGRAGAIGVELGTQAAGASALSQSAGNSIFKQTQDQIMQDLTGSGGTKLTDDAVNDALAGNTQKFDINNPLSRPLANPVANPIEQGIASGSIVTNKVRTGLAQANVSGTLNSSGAVGTTLNAGGSSLLAKAAQIGKGLLSADPLQQQAIMPIGDVGGQQFRSGISGQGGNASAGGSFLSQAMLDQMQRVQQNMKRGFNPL